MDLTLPPPATSRARFTVRSASSPSYCLSCRAGVGTLATPPPTQDDIKGQRAAATRKTDTHVSDRVNGALTVASIASREDEGTPSGGMATRSSQSDSGDERRLFQHDNMSNGQDRKEGPSSPEHRSGTAVALAFSGSQGERWTGRDRDRDRAEVTSPGTGNTNGPGQAAQALDRLTGVKTLPSRLKSRSMSGSTSGSTRETATSLGPKGGQSIWERIEKLYGSADDSARAKRFSAPLEDWRLPSREDSGRRSSTTDSPLSPPGSPWRDICVSGGKGPAPGSDGATCSVVGTMSLDRTRSRQSVAAQIRRARAAEAAAPPATCTLGEEDVKKERLPDPPELGEGRASGIEADGGEGAKVTSGLWSPNDAEGAGRPEKDRRPDANAKTAENAKEADKGGGEWFKSGTPKIHVKIPEAKKLVVPSVASVRNKISQYEALTQRAMSSAGAAGQHQRPRRAFSVPAELCGGGQRAAGDGPKKSESDRAVGSLRGRWEGGAGSSAWERGAATEAAGVRKSRSDRAIGELSDMGKTLRNGAGQSDSGGSGIRSEPQEEARGQARPNAVPASTGKVDSNAQSGERRGGDGAEEEGKGGTREVRGDLPVDEGDRRTPWSQSDVAAKALALSLPLTNANNNNNGSLRDQKAHDANDGDDMTPTNPESPWPSAVAGDKDSAEVSSSQAQELSSGPSQQPLPSLLSATSKSTPSKLPDVVPSPVQVLSLSSVKKQGADDTLETWVKTQGAADDTLEAWVTTWNQRIQGWNDEDDDEGTEKDHDSNYDSDESSATITSSQSDRRSFCVSLADLCNLGGVDYESESDSSSEDWCNSLRSDMSALSYVSVMPAEELERLLQDVRGLGDSALQSYEDVQVVVLHKEIGVGLGFSIAGGLDQNKPVTVHKVFPSGAAAQEGSIREGDHVLSINGTALCGSAHFEALRTLRRAKERGMGVVVLRRGRAAAPYKAGGAVQEATQTPPTGQRVCVRLEKHSRDLGFSLEGGAGSSLGDKPLSIQKIFQGGPVEQVCPGDQLLQIQDVSVLGMRRLEVWTLIKTLPPGPVDVVLHRPHKTPQT